MEAGKPIRRRIINQGYNCRKSTKGIDLFITAGKAENLTKNTWRFCIWVLLIDKEKNNTGSWISQVQVKSVLRNFKEVISLLWVLVSLDIKRFTLFGCREIKKENAYKASCTWNTTGLNKCDFFFLPLSLGSLFFIP